MRLAFACDLNHHPWMQWIGEICGLLTSVCWSGSSVAFTRAARVAGPSTVNHIRIWLALTILAIIHSVLFGIPFPFYAGTQRFLWLGISGLFGFVVADGLLLEAFLLLGPRVSMLLLTLAPAFGTLLGWVFLGEHPPLLKLAGITATTIGIGIVVSAGAPAGRRVSNWRGIFLGVGAAVGQACGFLFSKLGMQGEYSPFSANIIRLLAAGIGMTLLTLIRGQMIADARKLNDRRVFLTILAGTIAGPVVGVALALYSLSHVFIGIAITLTSLAPVILLPVDHFFFGERINIGAIAGTIISLAGVVLLFIA